MIEKRLFFASLALVMIGFVLEGFAFRLSYDWGYPLAVAGMVPLLVGLLMALVFGAVWVGEKSTAAPVDTKDRAHSADAPES